MVCRGVVAKQSAEYTHKLCKVFWDGVAGVSPGTYTSWKREKFCSSTRLLVQGRLAMPQATHEVVSVVRVIAQPIPMNSPEAKSPPAIAAIKNELDGHHRRGTWDFESVREHYDLVHGPDIKDFMLGRGYGSMGQQNADLTPAEVIWKYRAVFLGSDIKTKTGVSAIELFHELGNAPVSFTSVRLMIAIAVLLGFVVTVRDALQAYLQARIDGDGRPQTWIEFPKEWWPDDWFYDGAKRQRPKYRRPVVHQRLALYGHPASGPLWDNVLFFALEKTGWAKVADWPGVRRNIDYSLLLVDIDDILMMCKEELVAKHWKAIEEAIEFKYDPGPIGQFIGARYILDEYDPTSPLWGLGKCLLTCADT